jgi:uncharacterized repeat protein (TIGR03803 family)
VRKIGFGKIVGIVAVFCVASAIASSAQAFKSLLSFDETNGEDSEAALVQGRDGNFYGTTSVGGVSNNGTVFEITRSGKLTTLYSFCSQALCSDGSLPFAGLMQAANGDFYGTTRGGGVYNEGTVFEITPAGKLTTLHSFCSQPPCSDGSQPLAAVVQGANGSFYGTTYKGGGSLSGGYGTVFEITASGKLTTLYSFEYGYRRRAWCKPRMANSMERLWGVGTMAMVRFLKSLQWAS